MDLEKSGRLIAALRKERGWTQKALAEKLCVTDRAVSKWERGAGFPDISLLVKLSGLLGVSAEELIQGERAAARTEAPAEDRAPAALLEQTVNGYRDIRKQRLRKWLCGILAAAAALLLCFLTAGELLHWNTVTFSGLATRYQAARLLSAVADGDLAGANALSYPNPSSPTPLEEGCRALEEAGVQIAARHFGGYYFNGADFAVDYRLEIRCGGEEYLFWVSFTEQNGKISGMSPSYSLENPPPDEALAALKAVFRHPQ